MNDTIDRDTVRRIAILQTDTVLPQFAGLHGQYPDMFQALLEQVDRKLVYTRFDVERERFPEQLDHFDAWLITGSRCSVYEDKDWIRRLQRFVLRLHRERRTLIGICFGHQLVAQALGGKTARAAVGWGVGVHQYRWRNQPDWITDKHPGFRLIASHQDQVLEPACGSVVLASSEFCPIAACQLGRHILTFQAHPEFSVGYSRALLDFRQERVGTETYSQGIASLTQATDSLRVAGWMVDFVRAKPQLAAQQGGAQ